MASLSEVAQRTPAHRERYVDLLRALAIVAVVIGHWLVVVVVDGPAGLTGFSALQELTWAHPVTWLFQVMPVFFLVGGFANAASLSSQLRRGGDAAGWLRQRAARLIPPTTALLVVLAVGSVLARVLGIDPEQVAMAAWLVSLPLWFLAAYLGVVLLTPVMYPLHQRAGLVVPVVLVGLVAGGDLVRFRYDAPLLVEANHLFAWLAIHQLGFAWYGGQLRRQAAAPLFAGGLVALLLLTVAGPYPISMVNVPGQAVQNVSPPTLALLALAATQLGLALLLRDPAERWLHQARPWLVVVAVNAVILTVFLWHMGAVVIVAVVLHLTGLLPAPPVDSAQWLWWQIPWIALLSVVLAALVVIFGRFERRGSPPVVSRPEWLRATVAGVRCHPRVLVGLTLAGCGGVLLGLLMIAVSVPADHGPLGLPTAAVLTFLTGAVILRLTRSQPSSVV